MKGYITFENKKDYENVILDVAYCSKKTAIKKAKIHLTPGAKLLIDKIDSGNKEIYTDAKGHRYFQI